MAATTNKKKIALSVNASPEGSRALAGRKLASARGGEPYGSRQGVGLGEKPVRTSIEMGKETRLYEKTYYKLGVVL